MSVTLDQILTLAGELDDAQGFDTPRERFRRFLLEHAEHAGIVRSFIDACQHAPGTQHRRALQDLVVLLGRFLGFDAAFGSYLPVTGRLAYHGQWRSRSRLHVAIEVRSDPSATANLESLLRSVAALKAATPGARFAGMCVLPPLYMRREKLEKTLASAKPDVPIGVVTLDCLMTLAEMAGAGRITHDEVLRLIESNIPMDFVVGVIERSAGRQAEAAPEPTRDAREKRAVETVASPAAEGPNFWIATVAPDHATPPEEVLELVVGRRHIFGLTEAPAPGEAIARAGDEICFHISGRGVVGRARIAGLEASGTGIRDAHRFRLLLRLEHLDLHVSAPVVVDAETELRLTSAGASAAHARAQTLMRVSHERFLVLTGRRESTVGNVVELVGGTSAGAPHPVLPDAAINAEDLR